MSSKAHAEFDPVTFNVRLAVQREVVGRRQMILWPTLVVADVTESAADPGDDAWLRLPEDDARAIYEALADYFGHAGHDTRALRKDYDSERARVDRLIGNLIGGAR